MEHYSRQDPSQAPLRRRAIHPTYPRAYQPECHCNSFTHEDRCISPFKARKHANSVSVVILSLSHYLFQTSLESFFVVVDLAVRSPWAIGLLDQCDTAVRNCSVEEYCGTEVKHAIVAALFKPNISPDPLPVHLANGPNS